MPKYYLCSICGNMIEMVDDKGNTPYCCNKPMQEQKPGATDGALEKHVPVIDLTPIEPNLVKVVVCVGSEPHPAESYHHITWIALETDKGMYRVELSPGCKPTATFYIHAKEVIINAYAYCNLHGLWKGGAFHG